MKQYDNYKNSGVEWLGDIPEHWELTRLGTRFLERRTKVSDKDYEPLSVTKNGVFPQLASAAKSNDGDNRKLVKKGDFVINSRSDRKASSGISLKLIVIDVMPNGLTYFYLESESVELSTTLSIRFDWLMDEFEEQQNKVTFIANNNKQTAVFLPTKRTNILDL